jgi:uncharacterized protein with ParB-like and HNH nuclease domain
MKNYDIQVTLIYDVLTDWKNQLIVQPKVSELQRPFTWGTQQICNLFDSLFRGLPIGNIIVWDNMFILSDDVTPTRFQRLLIDGKQRLTALAVGFGIAEVFNEKSIKIAFNPVTKEFKEQTISILNDKRWIPDISDILNCEQYLNTLHCYKVNNPHINAYAIDETFVEFALIRNAILPTVTLASNVDFNTAQLFTKYIL